MKSQFEHLPLEIYHTLEEYLTTTDVILLSQTSSYLRSVFGSMSWRTCKLLTDAQVQTSFSDCLHNLVVTPAQSSLPNKKEIRAIPTKVFYNPSRYRWFRSESVRSIVFHDLDSLVLSVNGLYKSAWIDILNAYPALNRLTFTSCSHPRELRDVLQCQMAFSKVKNALDCQLELTYEKYTKFLSLEQDQDFKAFELNLNLSELTITNWGTPYCPESQKYCNFQPLNLKKLKISVVDPLELEDILSSLVTLQSCERLIVTMLYIFTRKPNSSSQFDAQYTIDTLRCLQNIPECNVKTVELAISKLSALFYTSSRPFFHYADQYEKYLEGNEDGEKLVVDSVSCFQGAFEHREYLDKFAVFPKLSECLSLSDLSPLSSRLPLNYNELYFFGSLTSLDLSTDTKCYRLFLAIGQFTSLKYLKIGIQDDVSLFSSDEYLKYITQTTYSGFSPMSSSDDCDEFMDFVQNLGSVYYPLIQSLAGAIKKTYLNAIDVVYNSTDTNSSIWRLFFMDCFIYNLRHLFNLQQLTVEATGTTLSGSPFAFRLQELMNKSARLKNVSVKLKYFSHSDKIKLRPKKMEMNDFTPCNGLGISWTAMHGMDWMAQDHYYLMEYYQNSPRCI